MVGDVILVGNRVAVVVGVTEMELEVVTHAGEGMRIENKEYPSVATCSQLLESLEGAICVLAK